MKSRRYFRICVAVVCALIIFWNAVPQSIAYADIGWPPLNPSGASLGIQAGGYTSVRMVSEEVNLTIEAYQRPVPTGMEASPAYWMRGLVEAQFWMRNLGDAQEAFDVWFPLAASVRYPGMLPVIFPENTVQDFKVWIDGLPVNTEQVKAPDLSDPQQESSWARFPMTFPAGQDVVVHVNYTIYPSGRRPFGGFEYILQTGAGWKDTIGQATISVYLPDTVTPENVSLAGKSVEGLPIAPQPAGYTTENNVIRWQFTDLEPTAEDNIFVDVLEPGRYRSLLQARAGALNTPDSADAQLALANAIQNAVMVVKTVGQHGGGKNLAEGANNAYRRSLELAPKRAEIYSQYANWLLRTGGWISLMRDGTCPPELCDLVSRGLEAFPNNPELIKIDEKIRMMQEDHSSSATQAALNQKTTAQVVLDQTATAQVVLTQTAFAQATRQALNATPMPTQTILPSPSPGVTPDKAKETLAPAVPVNAPGGFGAGWQVILLLGLIAVVLLLVRLRRNAT